MSSNKNRHDHKQVAEANRNLYNISPEVSIDFQQFADIPYVASRVATTIEDCFTRLPAHHSVRVLDIGTGIGHLLAHIMSHALAQNIFAIDIAERNIEVARQRYPGVTFYIGDFLSDFPLPDKVELITAYSVLHHFADWAAFLNKADRLLNAGGILYLDHEPLDSLLARAYISLARIKNRRHRDLLLAEYHQFHGYLDLFEVSRHLKAMNYQVDLYFTNLSLIGDIIKKTGINLSSIIVQEMLVNSKRKRILKQAFLSYKIIAQKLDA